MEGLNAAEAVQKKRRSVASRKPRSTEQLASEYKDISCAPSRSISPDDDDDDDAGIEGGGHRRKELYLNGPELRGSTLHKGDMSKKIKREDRAGGDYDGHNRSSKSKDGKRSSEGVLALACSKNSGSSDGQHLPPSLPGENRPRKVKLKIGGLTRSMNTKTFQEAGDGGTFSTFDVSSDRHKHKDSGGQKYHNTNKDSHGNHIEGKHRDKHDISPSSDLVRKSKRVAKKRTLDSDSDEDGELRYLEKLKVAKVAPEQPATDHSVAHEDSIEDGLKKKKLIKFTKNKSAPYEVDEDFILLRSRDGRRKFKNGDGGDFIEEEEHGMEDPKKRMKEAGSPSDIKNETPGLTTRQRALQGRVGHGESLIEFPDGLPSAPTRKQKEKLSEVEIQAKKAEAAQRRKMQVEKAEREQQAEAMRKILGIDTEKKKEERKLKEREEQEKQTRLEEYKRNCIHCVMGPEGTVITFPDKMGLPTIFNSKPSSYPPPREKCAGPLCTNPYKYRDSKTKLPLCSLECYRAVQGSAPTLTC